MTTVTNEEGRTWEVDLPIRIPLPAGMYTVGMHTISVDTAHTYMLRGENSGKELIFIPSAGNGGTAIDVAWFYLLCTLWLD